MCEHSFSISFFSSSGKLIKKRLKSRRRNKMAAEMVTSIKILRWQRGGYITEKGPGCDVTTPLLVL